MNNLDKVVKKGIRAKIFRAPTLQDVEVGYEEDKYYYRVCVKVGMQDYSKCRVFKKTPLFLKEAVVSFNKLKNIKDLKLIAQSIGLKGVTPMFRPCLKKGLLNEDGILFVSSLLKKIEGAIHILQRGILAVQEAEGEIRAIYPYGSQLYSSTNIHLRDLRFLRSQLLELLSYNKEEGRRS